MVDALAEETLAEMAETFFGARVEIERLLDKLPLLAAELKERQGPLRRNAALLANLLLDRAALERFFACLDLSAELFWELVGQDQSEWRQVYTEPFAWTLKGRWMKSVHETYAALQYETDVYLNGRYERDPADPRRKRLSVHHGMIRKLADSVNRSIQRANEGERPSDVLRYMRSLDPMEQAKERATGATLENFDQRLDETMAMKPLDFDSLGLISLPELPACKVARGRTERFLNRLYAERGVEIRTLMLKLREELRKKSGCAPGEVGHGS